MRFNRVFSIELVALGLVFFVAGALLGVAVTSALYIPKASRLSQELALKSDRLALLEPLVAAPPDFAFLDETQPKPGVVGSQPAAATPALVPVPVPVLRRAEADRHKAGVVKSDPPQAAAVAQSKRNEGVRKNPVRSVTAAEIAAATRGSRIEGVSAQKASVSKVTKEGVYMSSGQLIRPGDTFSSGEKLLQVDPENNRIVTSERQLLLFFGS